MHELSYCEGVLDAVLRRAGGRPVTSLGVRIGVVHRVAAEAFQQSFEIAATGTGAAGARIELTVVPVHGHCLDCRAEFDADDPAPACPGCGSLDVAAEGGDEILLEWIGYPDTTADVPSELIAEHRHDTEKV